MQDMPQQDASTVRREELRSFVERFERLDEQRLEVIEQQKEVMAEAKARGYDPKILRRLIMIRRKDPEKLEEEDALLALYKEALEG